MLGPAPILDLDGTLVRLAVDWGRLRQTLGVGSLGQLWQGPQERWEPVTAEEVAGARGGEPVAGMIQRLQRCLGFAILTSNSSAAAEAFLHRYPALASRCLRVVGREQLGGPKTDWTRFRAGFESCAEATAASRRPGQIVYVGDAGYELDFAKRLGARAYSVAEVVNAATAP